MSYFFLKIQTIILKKWLRMNQYFDCSSQASSFYHLTEVLEIPYWKNESKFISIKKMGQFFEFTKKKSILKSCNSRTG